MKSCLLSALLITFTLVSMGQKSVIDVKSIHKQLVEIDDSIYASKYEVSNGEYVRFLEYLKEQGRLDEYEAAQIDSTRWEDELTYNKPFVEYYHTHAAYAEYPVVNISYKGATLFCDWMTDQYNAHPKKKFEQVRFRLPTEEEWTMAAKGGDTDATYPWGGNGLQNDKGIYLANFNTGKGDDMGVAGNLNENADITAPVESYKPNGYGLYNISGNVAEMVAEEGKAKGGSWLDPEQALRIDSDGNYEHPSPTVGFRYFMEILNP